jgi:hypothetical protein
MVRRFPNGKIMTEEDLARERLDTLLFQYGQVCFFYGRQSSEADAAWARIAKTGQEVFRLELERRAAERGGTA